MKTKAEFLSYWNQHIMPEFMRDYRKTGCKDYPASRQVWNDLIDSMIKDGDLPARAGNWTKPNNVEGK